MPARWRGTLALALILAVAAALRFYGLNWDAGQWLHPDERMIYFVAGRLDWPESWAQALTPESPLNPAFFAYGSLPIYLLRLVAWALAPVWPALRDARNLHLVGRPLAALFDLATVVLTYRLVCVLGVPGRREAAPAFPRPRWRGESRDRAGAKRGTGRDGAAGTGERVRWVESPFSGEALLAAAFVALAVLHVQNARFYTVDPILTAWVMLSLNLAAAERPLQGNVSWRRTWGRRAALGVALGLALATKVSAAPLLLVVPVALVLGRRPNQSLARAVVLPTLLIWGLAVVVAVAVQPYALIDAGTFLNDVLEEGRIARGVVEPPYTLQFAGTWPFVYSLWQTALWGVGLPLGVAAWAGLGAALVRWVRHGQRADALLLIWAGPQVLLTGVMYTRYLRYMLPVLPSLCVAAVWLVAGLRPRRGRRLVYGLLLASSLAYALAFTRIYAAPHSWIEASDWIYRQVPAGSVLLVEEWDTYLPLPLELEGHSRRVIEYDQRSLALYAEPDDGAKWESLATDLAASDYVVVASRRLYGSIPRRPDRYPLATRYYERLFAGQLGFELEAEFLRGPAWLNPRLPPLSNPAPGLLRPDESFVVYDHPRALIFRNVERLPAAELLRRIGVDGGREGP